jgi:hypothetical protein
MSVLRVLVLSFAFAAVAGAQTPAGTGTGSSSPSATERTATQVPSPAKTGTPAVPAVLVLRTTVNSKNAAEGMELKATLEKSIILPDGQILPRSTLLLGRIAQVSSHSKAKPNGAVLVIFDTARPKGGPVVPLLVRIQKLSPSSIAENTSQDMPRARVGGTSNSGGTEQLEFENADHSTLRSNMKQSDIEGIYLQNTAGGSGTIFSLGEDVYLDSDIRLTVLIAPAPATPN